VSEERFYQDILQLTRQLVRQRQSDLAFRPGADDVPYAARVYDEEEVVAGVRTMLDFWLTLASEGAAFERDLAAFLGVRASVLANSGSSANLLAVAALTSPKLGQRRLRPGDEVITVAAGFPTTIAPVIQCGCVPVFIDNDPATGNARLDMLQDAYAPGRTKAVMMAHTLGNPFDLRTVVEFCHRHGLWLIEDNCDALGSRYDGQFTGSFGDISTQSFYPPHHITLGEGGAVNIVREAGLKAIVQSFRDWGRDCWCRGGQDNTCGKRFCGQFASLPPGYDHKYVYSHLGYNLKPLEVQAAIGRAQMRKLPEFIQARQANWRRLRCELAPLEEFFDFMAPTHARSWSPEGFVWERGSPPVEPSWFGFMMLVKESAGFSRTDLAQALAERKIGNRMLFGGNLTRQPVLVQLRQEYEQGRWPANSPPYRTIGSLEGADRIMKQALFLGVYPGLSSEQLAYMAESVHEFCAASARAKSA
jgi:CDP-6-deoxy-D-xylo-4-hexulose-3-dehydrase